MFCILRVERKIPSSVCVQLCDDAILSVHYARELRGYPPRTVHQFASAQSPPHTLSYSAFRALSASLARNLRRCNMACGSAVSKGISKSSSSCCRSCCAMRAT